MSLYIGVLVNCDVIGSLKRNLYFALFLFAGSVVGFGAVHAESYLPLTFMGDVVR